MAILLQSLSSRTETTINLKWECDEKLDKIWYSTDNGVNYIEYDGTGNEGYIYINDLTPYTYYNVVLKGRTHTSSETIFSAVIETQTYDYPFCNYSPDFIIGNKTYLLFYNPLGHEITVNMIGADGSIISNDTITGTYLTGFIDDLTIDKLYESIPNAPSGTYSVKVTYEEHVSQTPGGEYSADEELCAPYILGDAACIDTNSATIAVTGNQRSLVRNASVPFFALTTFYAQNHATIASVKVNLNESIANLTIYPDAYIASGYGEPTDSAIPLNATFTVTDSRGFTAVKEKLITIYDWFEPEALIDLKRDTDNINKGVVNVHANYASINNKNTLTINGYIKKSTDTEYTSIGTLTSDVDKLFNADELYDYDVKIELIDALNGSKTYNLFLPRSKPLIYFDADKYSVGVNCLPINNETLEINGEDVYSALFYKANETLTITENSGYTNRFVTGGMLTGYSKEVWFSIPVPKIIGNLTPTLEMLKLNARKVSSGFIFTYTASGYDVLNDHNLTVTCNKSTNKILTVKIVSTTTLSETNNTPLTVDIENLVVKFA